jgi:hypothetical protein
MAMEFCPFVTLYKGVWANLEGGYPYNYSVIMTKVLPPRMKDECNP